jgi:hypothetical protein
MFTESMLSMPVQGVEEPGKTSYVPAVVAVGAAWMVALIRGIVGLSRGEGLSVDMLLTGLISALVPLAILFVWRFERRRRVEAEQGPHRDRPRLVLISGQPARNKTPSAVHAIGNRSGIDACLTHASLIKTSSRHAQISKARHLRGSEGRS